MHSGSSPHRNSIGVKLIAVITAMLLTFVCPACRPSPPSIHTFVAVPSEINAGGSAVLRWQVEGATTISIDQGIGKVSSAGSITVSPQKTLAYTLTASNKGGTVTRSVVVYVTPAAPVEARDITPPAIKDITSSLQNRTTAVISWVTNEPTSGKVEYGKNTQYGYTATSEELKTAHSVRLDDLEPNTIYHFRIIATDESGNETASPDNVFTTPSPKSPFSLQLQSLEWGREWEFQSEDYGEQRGRRFIYLKGTAQNTSKATLRAVICTMHCWSGDSLVKSEVYVYRSPILPGYVFEFHIKTLDDPAVDDVTIEFADEEGRQIVFTQK